MKIAIDEALPYWNEAFSALGEVHPFCGRTLDSTELHGTEALIVRSITPVNAALLDKSAVRFVATASAGMDNLDRDYLERRGLEFTYAAGCNADAVSEYVLATLLVVASRRGWKLSGKSLGVVGVGNVGSRVAKKARALGMSVVLCDPPLREATGDAKYRPLDEALETDIVTFHVPLTTQGPCPTHHMVNRALLDRLSPEQFIVNASRGAVCDSAALKTALKRKRIAGAILDVWEREPDIDYALLELADIGTPHIAGTSLDGKIRAVEMVRRALGRFSQSGSEWDSSSAYPPTATVRPEQGFAPQESVHSVLSAVFDVMKGDAELRRSATLPSAQAAAHFDAVRNGWPLRPEFRHFSVELSATNIDLAGAFEELGFGVIMNGRSHQEV